jgi:2-polyprenyl-3-methyl-5-hydroxy-6-metoxy-1,4-benzoquinol methylase
MIGLAENNGARDNITYITGDVMAHRLPVEHFDFIAAVAVIHHMPLRPMLCRLAELLRRGGTLSVVGLARNESPLDYAFSAASVLVSRFVKLWRGWWESPAPQAEPEMSFAEIRRTACDILPGVEARRRLFFRYTLLWRKP